MTPTRADRIKRVLGGVVRQAVADSGAACVSVCGPGADSDFIRDICVSSLGQDRLGTGGLQIYPHNKTALLLGHVPRADILLLGDLYYSQVLELTNWASLPNDVVELGHACGGLDRLDQALSRWFDGRATWEAAVADLAAGPAATLKVKLEAARFTRSRVGLVPKLGARTLGIDLYA